jgi:hypothetical protein
VKGFSDIGTSEERRYLLSGVLNTGAIASATLVLASLCNIPPLQSVLSENEANNVLDYYMSALRNKVIYICSK